MHESLGEGSQEQGGDGWLKHRSQSPTHSPEFLFVELG